MRKKKGSNKAGWTYNRWWPGAKTEILVKVDAFSEGLARVVVEEKYGYIDRTGEHVIKPQFDLASAFSTGAAQVVVGAKLAFVKKSGQVSTQAP